MAKGKIVKPFVSREKMGQGGVCVFIYRAYGLPIESMINVHKTLLPLAFYIANLINYTQPIITVIKAGLFLPFGLPLCTTNGYAI